MICLKKPFEKNQSTVDLLFTPIVRTEGVAIIYPQLAQDAHIPLQSTCGGKRKCGKCRVSFFRSCLCQECFLHPPVILKMRFEKSPHRLIERFHLLPGGRLF